MPADTLEAPASAPTSLPSDEAAPFVPSTPTPAPDPAPLNQAAGVDEPSADFPAPGFSVPDAEFGTSVEDVIGAKWEKLKLEEALERRKKDAAEADEQKAKAQAALEAKHPKPQDPAAEAAKTETKPAAVEPDADALVDADDAALKAEIESVTKSLSKEQREAFTKKTYENRDLRRQLAAAKAAQEAAAAKTVEVVKPDPATLAERDALKKRVEEQEANLAVHNLEATEQFRTTIKEPLAALEAKAAVVASGYEGITADEVKAALALPPGSARQKEISRLAGEMVLADQMEFFGIARDYQSIAGKRSELQANAKLTLENFEATKRAEQQQQEAAKKAAWNEAVPKALEKVMSQSPFLAPVEGNEAWNTRLSKAKEFAETAQFDAFAVDSQAEILHRAAILPLVNGYAKAVAQENANLKAELARFRESKPAAGPSPTRTPAPAATPSTPSGLSADLPFEEALAQRMLASGALKR